jgi:hypothetical protein
MLEARSAMAMIARDFELELDESEGPVKEYYGFVMVPSGLRVRLRERVPVAASAPTAADAGRLDLSGTG